MKKIVYLSGGIGGAKLAKGFYHSKDIDLTIIINTGDDEVIHGVPLSPDIDSVMYALAGIEGEMGWGIANDTFSVSEEYKKFIPQNFSIGDKDLALNLYRNQLLSEGKSLTEITKLFAEHLNLECNLIPMTDDTVSTKLKTDDGTLLDFQEYFVEKQAKPKLNEVVYNGAEKAKVSDELIKNIEEFTQFLNWRNEWRKFTKTSYLKSNEMLLIMKKNLAPDNSFLHMMTSWQLMQKVILKLSTDKD